MIPVPSIVSISPADVIESVLTLVANVSCPSRKPRSTVAVLQPLLLQVALMVFLGRVEGPRGFDVGHDRAAEARIRWSRRLVAACTEGALVPTGFGDEKGRSLVKLSGRPPLTRSLRHLTAFIKTALQGNK